MGSEMCIRDSNYTWTPPQNTQLHHDQKNGNVHKWQDGTTLITGDSMLLGVVERRLWNCKVRSHPGATIEDMYLHLQVHLQKKPTRVILLLGTNNCADDEANVIVEKLMRLKTFILSKCCCEVFFATLITRTDSYKLYTRVNEVNAQLRSMGIRLMDNGNIETRYLRKQGLHLNKGGVDMLIDNFVKFTQSLDYL